jgi:hypothetical protein
VLDVHAKQPGIAELQLKQATVEGLRAERLKYVPVGQKQSLLDELKRNPEPVSHTEQLAGEGQLRHPGIIV